MDKVKCNECGTEYYQTDSKVKIYANSEAVYVVCHKCLGHGGRRFGAGRKPLPESQKKRPVTVTLDPLEISLLEDIASKNSLSRSAAVALMIHETYRRMVKD